MRARPGCIRVKPRRPALNTGPAAVLPTAMPKPIDTIRSKVVDVFRELAGDRANNLDVPLAPSLGLFAEALSARHDAKTAHDIAFHLCDWAWDAAFLVAVHLFPEKFTKEEVEAGVSLLIIHAPNHLAAAAKLAGSPVQDVFEVGALDGNDQS